MIRGLNALERWKIAIEFEHGIPRSSHFLEILPSYITHGVNSKSMIENFSIPTKPSM